MKLSLSIHLAVYVSMLCIASQAIARVLQIAPSPQKMPTNTVHYTRLVAQPDAFYEKPLFIGIAVFVALIIGLVIGLAIARRTKK